MPNHEKPLVGILMGSKSDWEPAMRFASETLTKLEVPHEKRVLSAHRVADHLKEYSEIVRERGIEVLIAGAGGAAHLAGVTAANADHIPVIGVPIKTDDLGGLDSLLSTVQMPAGVPVASVGIGKKGAINAAILATQMLVAKHPQFLEALRLLHAQNAQKLLADDSEISAL